MPLLEQKSREEHGGTPDGKMTRAEGVDRLRRIPRRGGSISSFAAVVWQFNSCSIPQSTPRAAPRARL